MVIKDTKNDLLYNIYAVMDNQFLALHKLYIALFAYLI